MFYSCFLWFFAEKHQNLASGWLVGYSLSASMYQKIATEIDLVPCNSISHIQSILCFITKGIRSSTVKMSPPQENVLIYQKSQEIIWQVRLITVNFYQKRNHKVSIFWCSMMALLWVLQWVSAYSHFYSHF